MPYEIVGTKGVPVGIRQYPGMDKPVTARVDGLVRVLVVGAHDGWSQVRLLSGAQAGVTGWTHSVGVAAAATGTVIDLNEMKQLFMLMRDARFTFNTVEYAIPYQYPREGCFARAEVMAGILAKLSYDVNKVFAVCTGGLHVATPYGSDLVDFGGHLQVGWWYHVAPLLYLETGGDKPEGLVIDPSVATDPITPWKWAQAFATKQVEPEMTYDVMRKRLVTDGKYPSDETWLMRSAAIVYSLPAADNPYSTMEANAGQPEAVLADKARYVPAHEVIAAFDALFRACFKAQQAGKRDDKSPIPDYGTRLTQPLAAVDNLSKELRSYIVNSFPNFLADWRQTFGGTGIDGDVQRLEQKLSA
jgi:hypothetical protein